LQLHRHFHDLTVGCREHLMFPVVLRRTTEEIAMQTIRTEAVQSPFGDRDRWPITGPIYGFLPEEQCDPPTRGRKWHGWLFRDKDNTRQGSTGPVSPIHY